MFHTFLITFKLCFKLITSHALLFQLILNFLIKLFRQMLGVAEIRKIFPMGNITKVTAETSQVHSLELIE